MKKVKEAKMKKIVMVVAAVTAIVALSGVMGQAQADDEVEAKIKAKVELEQNGADVDVEVEAEGLLPNASFTVRPYKSTVINCIRGAGNALAAFGTTSDDEGELEISGTITGKVVDDVGSVSIRSTGSPPANPPVVCFQDTTP